MSVRDGQWPGSAEWVAHARESYDRVAQPYADLTRPSATDQPEMADAYDRLAEQANPGPVVDVGCGPGWWLAHLARRGIEAVGVDLSPRMVELARVNAPDCRVEVGDMTHLPLADASVGGVACWFVLHHVPDEDLDAALAELARVLRPGGVMLLGGHVGQGSRLKTEGYGGHVVHVQVNRRTAASWEERLTRCGLCTASNTVHEAGEPGQWHELFAVKE